jgi:hypothetical protein
MVKIRDANGQVREGTWAEFWQDYHNTLKHGYQSPSKKKVEHAAQDHSLAAAQREMAKTMGKGFMDAFGGGDRRPIEQKIAQEVVKQLNIHAPKSQETMHTPATQSITTPKAKHQRFSLADASRALRESGISDWPGQLSKTEATARYAAQSPTQPVQQSQQPTQIVQSVQTSKVQQSSTEKVPTKEQIRHVFKRDPMLSVLMMRRPDMFEDHPFWAPYYRELMAQSSQARRVTHSSVCGPTMIVKPIIVKPIMVKP